MNHFMFDSAPVLKWRLLCEYREMEMAELVARFAAVCVLVAFAAGVLA